MIIYLADLVHDYLPGNYVTPLNIGLLKAYLMNRFKDDVEVKLFKSPENLLNIIKNGIQPDVVGFSNYGWNAELNQHVIHRVLEYSPNSVICSGGPHIRVDPDGIADYLKKNNEIDYY